MAIIYKATCTLTNKSYIGYTSMRLKERFKTCGNRAHLHRAFIQKCNSKFYNALRKYGWRNFKVTILEKMDIEYARHIEKNGKTFISNREIYWIAYYDSYNNGYNMTLGGDGIFGLHLSDETKAKLSKIHKGNHYGRGYQHTDSAKVKISAASKGRQTSLGRVQSVEERQKRANALKGKKRTDEQRKRMSLAQQGRRLTDEQKSKLRQKRIDNGTNKLSDETKAKISKANRGRKLSNETKQKIGLASKKRLRSKEWCDKISRAKKGVKRKPLTDEQKNKISIAIKEHYRRLQNAQ